MDKKLLAVMFAAGIIVTGIWLSFAFNPAVHEHSEVSVAHTAVAKIEKISLWQSGKEKIVEINTKLANDLISTLEKTNIQATCAIFEEDVERLKQEGKVVEITFREPVNITISQWIEPDDRNHIPTNASGYRILTNVEKVLFVLEGDYKGHILTKGTDVKGYGCWAILKDDEMDKSWIDEVEKAFKLKYEVEECSVGFEPEKVIEYDEDTKTLTAYVRVNCCGINVTVEKENNTYKIIEKQYGELCRCMCVRKVTIYNVPVGARVEFVDKDGVIRTLTPDAYSLPLTGLWRTVLENAEIENETAVLQWLYVEIDRDGRVEHIVLEFTGTFDGEPRRYQIKVSGGKVKWHSWKTEEVSEGSHPLTLFRELEKLNIKEIPSGENGITIDASPVLGSVGYDDKYSDIYLLKNGVLIRLKRIVFDSDVPWYPIEICKREKYNASIVEANRTEAYMEVNINITEGNKEISAS